VDELSLFVLAYNEAPNIEHTVLDCLATLPRLARRYELLIIDDGSTDRTNAIASELAGAHEHVRLVTHPQNSGWGNTQKTGFENSRYELVTYVPGDYQVRIDAVERMLPYTRGADIVIGTRRERKDYPARVRAAEFYNFTLRTMFGIKVRDIDSIKIVRKRVLDDIRIQSNSANVDVELIVRAHRRGYRIAEVDVPHYARTAGEQSGVSPRVMQRQLRELVPFWRRNIR
jgi:glycosyltransferase involved in cell wall biosynthesis